MKIGDVELTTTSEEIDELLYNAVAMGDSDIESLKALFDNSSECGGLVSATQKARIIGTPVKSQVGAILAAGILIGAEIYRRRAEEKGAEK